VEFFLSNKPGHFDTFWLLTSAEKKIVPL